MLLVHLFAPSLDNGTPATTVVCNKNHCMKYIAQRGVTKGPPIWRRKPT